MEKKSWQRETIGRKEVAQLLVDPERKEKRRETLKDLVSLDTKIPVIPELSTWQFQFFNGIIWASRVSSRFWAIIRAESGPSNKLRIEYLRDPRNYRSVT